MIAFARRAGQWLYGQPYLLLSLTSLFWAGNQVVGRAVAGHVPPVALAYLRWWAALAVVAGFAWPHLKRDWPVVRRHWRILALLAFCGITTFNTLAYYGLQYTQALNGVLMQSSMPLIIALVCFVLYGQRLTAGQGTGIAVSLLGVGLIVTRGDPSALADLRINAGDAWLVVANLFYALYSALLRRKPALHWLTFLAVTFALGALMLTPAFVWEYVSGARVQADAATGLALFYVVLFPSVLAYTCFNRGVELVGANRAGPFFHLIPLFGSGLAIAFLGERLETFHLLAYGLILAGIAIAARRG